ncbi:MAG: FecR family protein [Gammaproteobacteria bacterium]|nr:FecR family protein [Gammaproteobacteria bacterium]
MNTRNLGQKLPTRKAIKVLLLVLMLAVSYAGSAQNIQDNESNVGIVGEVSLVIGKAFLESVNKQQARIRIGDFIREGETVRTESTGHVHLRFIDKAVLSVRPSSELQVLAYRFDEANPRNSLVKLNLIEGTARAVSGEAAKIAKERFRLNTPIAAIGVRGTDFVVSTTSNSLKALVNDGAIVVAPFSTQCLQAGTGPCSFNSVELGGGAMQVLEFDSEMAAPRLVPILAAGQDAAQFEGLVGSLSAARQSSDGDVADLMDVSAEDEAASFSGSGGITVAGITDRDVVTESITSVNVGDSAKNQAPYGTGYTPQLKYSPAQLRQRQLVWGRFADGEGNLERLTLPLSEASEGRKVSVGANFEYFLFRPEQGEAQVNPGLGEIGFSLASAQAYFKSGHKVSPVVVSKGDLIMDFGSNTFETSLDLYHMQLGDARFAASGNIYSGGYFHLRNDQSSIVGAVSLDGKESGYSFDFLNWEGVVQGITLWDAN